MNNAVHYYKPASVVSVNGGNLDLPVHVPIPVVVC